MKLKMGKSIAQLYKTARRYLNLNQKDVAKALGISEVSISKVETGKTQHPNHDYTKFLVEKGINYFYLTGLSDQIEGQKIDGITRAEHETLQQNFDDLEKNYQELENRYNLLERVLQLLQIEVDEVGNVKQKK